VETLGENVIGQVIVGNRVCLATGSCNSSSKQEEIGNHVQTTLEVLGCQATTGVQ